MEGGFLWKQDWKANCLSPPSLEEASWAQIRAISSLGLASSVFRVGDTKKIVLNGTVGTAQFDNYETYVYIIGIDHNKEIEGTGITFGCFKNKDGKDITLIDTKYGNHSEDGTKYFNMNHSSSTNSGGWKGCDLRYDVLGSTNTNDGDATVTTATNPVANTLMAALPPDLRAVMQPMTIYTDNMGGGEDNASYVTKTTDYLPLLAEYEIFGARTYANSAEKNYQTQYTYYSAGNSKVKYRNIATSSAAWWWGRSPGYNGNNYFCFVALDGSTYYYAARYSGGVAPIFRV